MCTTNDDAVVDCVVYANELRMDERLTRVDAVRRVVDGPPSEGSSCSITMCGNDDGPGCRLLRYCRNGHRMHDRCLEDMFLTADTLSVVVCPQCRSDDIVRMVTRAKPIPNVLAMEAVCGDGSTVGRAMAAEMHGFESTDVLHLLLTAKTIK
jgi:hypothetical protein